MTFGKDQNVEGENNPMYGIHRYGKDSPHYGKKHSEETKRNLSEKRKEWHKTNTNPMLGKKRPDLVLRNILNKGKKYSQETNLKKGRKREENHNWRGGIARLPYPYEFNIILKIKIKIRDNFTCQCCGERPIKLYIHHIDYNKFNNIEINLISLCDSCHSKTNFNRRYWEDLLSCFMAHKLETRYNERWDYLNTPLIETYA